MPDLLSDAAFTNVEITKNIIFRDEFLVDENRNMFANVMECNLLRYVNLERIGGTTSTTSATPIDGSRDFNFQQFQNTSTDFRKNPTERFEKFLGDQNTDSEEVGALVVGGSLNEASGEYATCVSGQNNEATGTDSITLGGSENMANGDSSVAMGVNAVALHPNTFVWNSNTESSLVSTIPKQCIIGCDNGLFFKLPKSTVIQSHLIPEGFACWCWDESQQNLCLKTKQDDTVYKTNLPSVLIPDVQVIITDGVVQLVSSDTV